jgi:bifunctional DNA-binding transcriptional regulator/antitoxin component of YhaV-PrlF toxin-antitoxin module
MPFMKVARISKGGRVSIPAAVRNRWGADQVLIEDRGDALVLRPLPADPIGAALDLFPAAGPSTDGARTRIRDEDSAQVDRALINDMTEEEATSLAVEAQHETRKSR